MTNELKELAVDKTAAAQLKSYIEAIENGFDTKVMKKIIVLRKRSKEELDEEEYLLETYKEALGMQDRESNEFWIEGAIMSAKIKAANSAFCAAFKK